jgi:hypothetical protein
LRATRWASSILVGPNAGKIKRVREVLIEAAQKDPIRGGQLLRQLVDQLKGVGEFPRLAETECLRASEVRFAWQASRWRTTAPSPH